MKVHHVGYLVKNINKAEDHFKVLGFQEITPVKYDKYRDVDILFMKMDEYVIELVSPKSKESVVAHLIKTYRNSPYHICYETEDFEEKISELELSGFTCFDGPCPAPALDDRRVCFLLSPRAGMVEILEKGL